jgi:hypothetical protein
MDHLLFPIPWPLLNAVTEEGVFRIALDPRRLEPSQGFHRDEGPHTMRRTQVNDVYAAFQCKPVWKRL